MNSFKNGDIVEVEVTGITGYGIFVKLEDNYSGLIHISEISNEFVGDINKLYTIGNIIKAKIIDIDEDNLHVKLSIKKIRNNFQKKNKKIKEFGTGFAVLQNSIEEWIKEKIDNI